MRSIYCIVLYSLHLANEPSVLTANVEAAGKGLKRLFYQLGFFAKCVWYRSEEVIASQRCWIKGMMTIMSPAGMVQRKTTHAKASVSKVNKAAFL